MRISTGDADVNEAAELMINLFWRGLGRQPRERRCRVANESSRG